MLPPLDDAEAMAVFADMLSVRGDPRGELAHLHLALEQRPGDPRLVRAAEQHLARNDRQLLGGLRTFTSLCDFTWQRGYIVEARLKSREGAGVWAPLVRRRGAAARGGWLEAPTSQKLARVTRELLQLESAAPMQMLSITVPRSSSARAVIFGCLDELKRLRRDSLHVLGLFFSDVGEWWNAEESLGATKEAQLGALHVSADVSLADEVFARLS